MLNAAVIVDAGLLVPEFDPDIKNYWVNVSSNVSSITIQQSFDNTVLRSKAYNLDHDGLHVFSINVTNFKYTINVNRVSPTASSDATLKSITPEVASVCPALFPIFNPSVTHYTVLAPYPASSISLTGEPNDGKALVKVSGRKELKVGVNTYEIDVYAEDGITTKKYVFDVVQLIPGTDLYWTLSNLSVEEGIIQPAFDLLIKSYTVEVPRNTTEANIHATPTFASHTVSGTGKLALDSDLKRFYSCSPTRPKTPASMNWM
jgi:hypothetical protein